MAKRSSARSASKPTGASNIAIFPGSFDPPTFGHINIIERSIKVFRHVIVAIADNSKKRALFNSEERIDILKQIFRNEPNIEFDSFNGLLVDYVRKKQIFTIVRGIRTVGDYEYELQMSLANRILEPSIETVFMMTEGRYSHISSSIIKEVIALGGSAKHMIHPFVEQLLKKKLFPKTKPL
jgi:pantetheine-phosphate adenylyltransferase